MLNLTAFWLVLVLVLNTYKNVKYCIIAEHRRLLYLCNVSELMFYADMISSCIAVNVLGLIKEKIFSCLDRMTLNQNLLSVSQIV